MDLLHYIYHMIRPCLKLPSLPIVLTLHQIQVIWSLPTSPIVSLAFLSLKCSSHNSSGIFQVILCLSLPGALHWLFSGTGIVSSSFTTYPSSLSLNIALQRVLLCPLYLKQLTLPSLLLPHTPLLSQQYICLLYFPQATNILFIYLFIFLLLH